MDPWLEEMEQTIKDFLIGDIWIRHEHNLFIYIYYNRGISLKNVHPNEEYW